MSAYVAKHLRNRQKNWNMATQRRITLPSTILEKISNVKVLGPLDFLKSRVQDLRHEEITMSERVRWIMVAYNTSGMSLYLISLKYRCPC
jgi:ATP-binding cassette subfamily C (CFTR/MRP) protein 1